MAFPNKLSFSGPTALSNAAANILNPPTLSGGVGTSSDSNTYVIIRHITIVNKTASNATVSLFIGASGASAAGTEFWVNGTTVTANNNIQWFGARRLTTSLFLTGLASAATTLTIDIEYEIGVI